MRLAPLLAAFAICAVVGIANWADVEGLTSDDELLGDAVQVGWGLVITSLAAIAGAGLSGWLGLRPGPRPEPPQPLPVPRPDTLYTTGHIEVIDPIAPVTPDPAPPAQARPGPFDRR